jgi:chromosome partitioning protein
MIERIKQASGNSRLELEGILMTMYDARTKLSPEVVRSVREYLAGKVYDTIIPRSVRLSEAPSHGKSILDYDPDGVGAQMYRALAREFLARQN